MNKTTSWILIAFFLVIISAVPTVQAVLEILDDEVPQFLELFENAPTEENLRSFEADIEEYSFFEENLRPFYQSFAYSGWKDMGAKAIHAGNGWFFYAPGVKYLSEPYYADIETEPLDANDATQEDPLDVIASFSKELAQRGIHMILMPIPGKASIYPDRLSFSSLPGDLVYENTVRFVKEAKQRGVDVFWVHDILRQSRAEADANNTLLYMKSDTHWSGDGIIPVAKALAEKVSHLLGTAHKPHPELYKRTLKIVTRRGDIPEMTQIQNQEELFDSESVQTYQISKVQGSSLYEDDPESPVLLLGDSFSRVFHTDEPNSAGLIANLAYELQIPITSIVNDGGASTLVRQELARDLSVLKNKKILIWEFIERDIRFGMRGWQNISLKETNE